MNFNRWAFAFFAVTRLHCWMLPARLALVFVQTAAAQEFAANALSRLFNHPMNFLRQRSKKHFFQIQQLSDGLHLACETVIKNDLKVHVPSESVTAGQVLQVEGSKNIAQPDPLIKPENGQVERTCIE